MACLSLATQASGWCGAFFAKTFDEVDRLGLLGRVEISEGADERLEQTGRRVPSFTEVARPVRKKSKVEVVGRSQLRDDRWIGVPDDTALDLGQVGVGDAGPALDVAQGEALVGPCALQDLTQYGLGGLRVLIVKISVGLSHSPSVALLSASSQRLLANVIRIWAKMIRG